MNRRIWLGLLLTAIFLMAEFLGGIVLGPALCDAMWGRGQQKEGYVCER